MVVSDMFLQLALVVSIAAFSAFFFRLIRQPQLLAYIIVGVLIGPVFNLVTDLTMIESMSTIGIAFLLFLVGLEIDIKKLKNVALVSTFGGTIQIAVLFLVAFLIALSLSFVSIEAIYIALMLAFSSTMIVMKFLSDRRELSTLHGRIIVGILLLEDVIAILALSVLTSINGFEASLLIVALLKFLSLFGLAYVCSKFLFPSIFKFSAKNPELLLITSLATCFLFSLIFQYLGFSIVIGAFVAGLTLGNLQYNVEIIARVKSLRDFFSLIFFVSLGMALTVASLKSYWLALIIYIIFLLVFKPLLIMTICSVFKFTRKPSFYTAIYLAQAGEFALIIASQGLYLGHIGQELFSMIVFLTILSMTLTSYVIKFSDKLYKLFSEKLKIFEIFNAEGLEFIPTEIKPTIILCGHNRVGYSILKSLNKMKNKILIVDYNPEIISKLVKQGYHCIYGEADDNEIIERMNLKNVKYLLSTIPYLKENKKLIKRTRSVNKKAKIIVTADKIEDALKFYDLGANYVILPHFLGGEHVANLFSKVRKREVKLKDERDSHLKELKERMKIGHDHPVQMG